MNTEEMLDGVVETLEPHAMYYNYGRDDTARYFPEPEVLHYLSLVLTSVVLPILTNVISDEIKEKLKKRRDSSDIDEAVRQASVGPAPSQEAIKAAAEAAAEVLRHYGWPSAFAEVDAESAVARVASSTFDRTETARMEWSDLRHLQDASILEGVAVAIGMPEISGSPSNDKSVRARTQAALADLVREFPHRRPPESDLKVVGHPSLASAGESGYRLARGPTDALDYWRDWEVSCDVWLLNPNKHNEVHVPASLVFSALNEENDLSLIERRDLVQLLWSERWILDDGDAALMMQMFEQVAGVPQDADRLECLTEETTSRLVDLKNNCRSLDEWFESLRELAPLVSRGYALAARLGDNKTHRLFDEMHADLMVVLGRPFREYVSRGNFFEDQLVGSTSADVAGKKRALRFKLNARIYFPRFWYDTTVAYLDSDEGPVPKELIEYDTATAVACWIATDLSVAIDDLKRMDIPFEASTGVLPLPPG